MSLYLGKMVLYRWRPGEVRAGNVDAAAMITRIYPDQSLDLTVYPAMDRDPRFQIKVPPMSEKAQFHCWHRNEDDRKIQSLEEMVLSLSERLVELELAQAEPSPPTLQEIASSAVSDEADRKRHARRRKAQSLVDQS